MEFGTRIKYVILLFKKWYLEWKEGNKPCDPVKDIETISSGNKTYVERLDEIEKGIESLVERSPELLEDLYETKLKKEEKPMLTLEQLVKCNEGKNAQDCEFYLNSINKICPTYEIDTPLRMAHFLAQTIHESGNMKFKVENLNYSDTALISVFGKYFNADGSGGKKKASDFARKPEAIANVVYANRMGNGNEASGEGWKYRGRGLIQMTGKNNYTAFSNYSKIDGVNNPDLLMTDVDTMVTAACWYWKQGNGDLNAFADVDDVMTITKRINGGTNGLEHRTKVLAICKKELGC